MIEQAQIFHLFLWLTGAVTLVFGVVGWSTRRPRTVEYASVQRLRTRWFFVFSGVVIFLLVLTLPLMPYPTSREDPSRTIHVAARQYAFLISTTAVTDEQAEGEDPIETPVFEVGEPVEFRVTSLDVTHGFGIYSPGGKLLAQTQAMPGYVNRLRYRFDQPGIYPVLCLELCGMAHHVMRSTLVVRAPETAHLSP